MNLSRFKPPCAADEFYDCPGCGASFHYTSLDQLGLCQNCRSDKLCDEAEEQEKDRKLTKEDDL